MFTLGLLPVISTLNGSITVQDLNKSAEKQADENFVVEISRLEFSITVTQDDLVSILLSLQCTFFNNEYTFLSV